MTATMKIASRSVILLSILTMVCAGIRSQAPSVSLNRSRGQNMLNEIRSAIKDHYYDKKFHGIDLDDRFKFAAEKIKKLEHNWQIFRAIAQVVLELEDSHTMFYPPNRVNQVEYGFSVQMLGDRCIVVDVKKGSDADRQHLKLGDQIVRIGEYQPARETLWKINYAFYLLDPKAIIRLVVLNSDGKERLMAVKATFKSIADRNKEAKEHSKQEKERPYMCDPIDAATIACKLKTFSVEKSDIDKMFREIGLRKKLILDLRGNHGGYVQIGEYLTGYIFDREVKIGTSVARDKKADRIAKPVGAKYYSGEIIVLIDSLSASASEVFARVIQLERRGQVLGDVSAGAVMTSKFLRMASIRGRGSNFETYSVFGLNLTVADLIMSDGNRLEKVGVTPDKYAVPTGAALRGRLDPVLSIAASMLGATLTPLEAGKFKFIIKNEEIDEDENTGDL